MSLLRKVAASVVTVAIVLPTVACGVQFEPITLGQFEDALEFIGLEYEPYAGELPPEGKYSFVEEEEKGADASYGLGVLNNHYAYMDFYDEAVGDEYFKKLYDEFEDDLKEQRFQGKCEFSYEPGNGYVLYDGENDGVYTYGAMYYRDGIYLAVYTNTDKHKAVDEVKSFLDHLGFTKPE